MDQFNEVTNRGQDCEKNSAVQNDGQPSNKAERVQQSEFEKSRTQNDGRQTSNSNRILCDGGSAKRPRLSSTGSSDDNKSIQDGLLINTVLGHNEPVGEPPLANQRAHLEQTAEREGVHAMDSVTTSDKRVRLADYRDAGLYCHMGVVGLLLDETPAQPRSQEMVDGHGLPIGIDTLLDVPTPSPGRPQ